MYSVSSSRPFFPLWRDLLINLEIRSVEFCVYYWFLHYIAIIVIIIETLRQSPTELSLLLSSDSASLTGQCASGILLPPPPQHGATDTVASPPTFASLQSIQIQVLTFKSQFSFEKELSPPPQEVFISAYFVRRCGNLQKLRRHCRQPHSRVYSSKSIAMKLKARPSSFPGGGFACLEPLHWWFLPSSQCHSSRPVKSLGDKWSRISLSTECFKVLGFFCFVLFLVTLLASFLSFLLNPPSPGLSSEISRVASADCAEMGWEGLVMGWLD